MVQGPYFAITPLRGHSSIADDRLRQQYGKLRTEQN
jgi:hypothetical protein